MTKLLTVRELLQHRALDTAELVAGARGLDRSIRRLNVMTAPHIERWVEAEEFLLATGFPLPHADMERLLTELDNLGLAGLGVKLDDYLPELAPQVIDLADELGFPIIVIPPEIRFDDILSEAFGTIVNRQAVELAQAHDIHDAFLNMTLAGGGIASLARDLAHLLRGAHVAICSEVGVLLAQSGDLETLRRLGLMNDAQMIDVAALTVGIHQDDKSGLGWAVGVVRAGPLHHGYVIAVEGDSPLGDVALTAVDEASIVAALEVTRDLAVGAVERQFASNVLHEIISSAREELSDAVSRGMSFGWDLDRSVAVLVCKPEPMQERPLSKRQSRLSQQRAIEFWASMVRKRDPGAAAAGLGVELVAVVDGAADPKRIALSFQSEMTTFTRRQYSIGVSRPYPGPAGITKAYGEARAALRLGPRVTGLASITSYAELGLFRLLAQVDETELMAFLNDTLGSVLTLPEQERDDLLLTLEALFEHNLNVAETARHVHYHYNTLRYRLAKLERMLGPFSSDAATSRRVGVALEIRKMRLAIG